MALLDNYYKTLGKKKFLSLAALLMFVSDVMNISYINMFFLPEKITLNYLLNFYSLMGANPEMLHPLYLRELRQVLMNSFSFLFLGFLVYHILVYFKLARDSKWAKKYVFGYALTGAALTLFELPGLAQDHLGWFVAMLATTLIYIYSFLGLRHFKKSTKKK